MPEPMIRRPGDDAAIANPVGGEITFKVCGEHTDGRLVVLETIVGVQLVLFCPPVSSPLEGPWLLERCWLTSA